MGDERNERDADGNLTAYALACDALSDHGCDCGGDEAGSCLACKCELAMTTERARAEKAEATVAALESRLTDEAAARAHVEAEVERLTKERDEAERFRQSAVEDSCGQWEARLNAERDRDRLKRGLSGMLASAVVSSTVFIARRKIADAVAHLDAGCEWDGSAGGDDDGDAARTKLAKAVEALRESKELASRMKRTGDSFLWAIVRITSAALAEIVEVAE